MMDHERMDLLARVMLGIMLVIFAGALLALGLVAAVELLR